MISKDSHNKNFKDEVSKNLLNQGLVHHGFDDYKIGFETNKYNSSVFRQERFSMKKSKRYQFKRKLKRRRTLQRDGILNILRSLCKIVGTLGSYYVSYFIKLP